MVAHYVANLLQIMLMFRLLDGPRGSKPGAEEGVRRLEAGSNAAEE